MPVKTVNISATIPIELDKKLSTYCGKTGLKKSTVIARALEEHLASFGRKTKKGDDR